METQTNFKVLGIHCQSCQKVIERKLMKISGVSQIKVELNGLAIITANRLVSLDEVKQSLEGTDYTILPSS